MNLQNTVFTKILSELTDIKELLYKLSGAKITGHYHQEESQSSVHSEAPQASLPATCQKQKTSGG